MRHTLVTLIKSAAVRLKRDRPMNVLVKSEGRHGVRARGVCQAVRRVL